LKFFVKHNSDIDLQNETVNQILTRALSDTNELTSE